jgi:xylulokinase
LDLRRRAWDPVLLDGLGLPLSIWPTVRPSWETVGTLRPAVAERVGLPASTSVVLGGADSQACALGAGVVAPGPVSEMAGSSTCLNAALTQPLEEPLVTHYPHVVPDMYTTETGINTTGTAASWVADRLYGGRRGRAGARDFALLDEEVGEVPAGADGVLALPILGDGERVDPSLRAAFTGLSMRHGRAVMARAMLEGVAYTIRSHLELLTHAGAPVTDLRVSGGDARLASWNRIKADVTGIPVTVIPGDAAATGVAMLAGIGVGAFRDVEDAIVRCVHYGDRYDPDPANGEIYQGSYASFRALMASPAVTRRPERSL